jgi:hypothetical protein
MGSLGYVRWRKLCDVTLNVTSQVASSITSKRKIYQVSYIFLW